MHVREARAVRRSRAPSLHAALPEGEHARLRAHGLDVRAAEIVLGHHELLVGANAHRPARRCVRRAALGAPRAESEEENLASTKASAPRGGGKTRRWENERLRSSGNREVLGVSGRKGPKRDTSRRAMLAGQVFVEVHASRPRVVTS